MCRYSCGTFGQLLRLDYTEKFCLDYSNMVIFQRFSDFKFFLLNNRCTCGWLGEQSSVACIYIYMCVGDACAGGQS